MPKGFQNLKRLIHEHDLLSDEELETLESFLSSRNNLRSGDVARLLSEYRLVRALLTNALDQRARILQLEEREYQRTTRERTFV